jgi:hypothetical protein
MNIEDRIKGKNPNRVLPQWRRQLLVQKQRVRGQALITVIFGVLGISRFFVAVIPFWLQILCFVFLPISILCLSFDMRLCVVRKRDVEELEKLIQVEKVSQDD